MNPTDPTTTLNKMYAALNDGFSAEAALNELVLEQASETPEQRVNEILTRLVGPSEAAQ